MDSGVYVPDMSRVSFLWTDHPNAAAGEDTQVVPRMNSAALSVGTGTHAHTNTQISVHTSIAKVAKIREKCEIKVSKEETI